jgi:hypothetical protein
MKISDLAFSGSLDTDKFRRILGLAAKNEKKPWYKDVTRGERLAETLAPCLDCIPDKPLSKILTSLRLWVDEQ